MSMRFYRLLSRPGLLLSPPNLLLAVVCVFILSQQRALSQRVDPAHKAVTWEFGVRQGSDDGPILVFHARIRDGWKLYSTANPDSLGYSRISLDGAGHAKISYIEEKGAFERQTDPIFNGSETGYYLHDAEFLVHVKPVSSESTSSAEAGPSSSGDLRGTLTFIAVRNDSVAGPTDIAFRCGRGAGGAWSLTSQGGSER